MSGRLGYKPDNDSFQASVARSDEARNRKAARMFLQRLVVKHAGWKGLDDWAEQALDKLERGGKVDLSKLKADIAEWQEAHKEEL